MKNSSHPSYIFASFSRAAVLLSIAATIVVSATSVLAQENGAATARPSPPALTTNTPDFAKTAGDYKSSLRALSTLYQNEVERLEKQNTQSQQLFKDGLISRVEMEKSEKAIADARARV